MWNLLEANYKDDLNYVSPDFPRRNCDLAAMVKG
jgi:hypothetical protein